MIHAAVGSAWVWRTIDKEFWAPGVGHVEDVAMCAGAHVGQLVRHVDVIAELDLGVVVFGVVQVKGIDAVRASAFEGAGARGRAILERFRVCFRVHVIVGHGGTLVRRGDAEMGKQVRNTLQTICHPRS